MISHEPFYWLTSDSRTFLKRGYLEEGEDPLDRIKSIAQTANDYLNDIHCKEDSVPPFAGDETITKFKEKFFDYMSRGWFSLASPIWANYGRKRGLPISCFGSYIPDQMDGILLKNAEIGMMTKLGGGTSAFFGDLRGRGAKISSGGESSGPVHFMELFETTTNIVSQSNVRRGSLAGYLPIDHPDVLEFLKIRSDGNKIQQMSIGLTIKDDWMKDMIAGDKSKRQIWMKVLQKRFESGYPYLIFIDSMNRLKPEVYKKHGDMIHASNLCCEIALPSSARWSFVCCLSSMNLLHYDEWKDTDAVQILTYFLDAVMEEFIEKSRDIPFLYSAHTFAEENRALGLGVLGWHSFLQSKNIPFESMEAKLLNTKIHKHIRNRAELASNTLACYYGVPEVMKGYPIRNATLMAIAPTTSSSFILGQVSPSVEPLNSNYFVKDLAKGKFTFKNPYLIDLLEKTGNNTPEIWHSILTHGGSVKHLKFLSEHEREVFKTFGEISQKEVVIQAIARQKYIDQAQSINLMIHPKTPVKEVNQLLIFAWENGLKSLYYHRGTNPSQELSRNLMNCSSCEA